MIVRAIWTRLTPGIATLALALASGAANANCDVMTGGGFIINNGAHANFGVAGGCKDGTPTFGHLEYIDHGTSLNVHWTSITAYQFESDGTDSKGRPIGSRFICGKARTNLPPPNDDNVDFAVRAKDAGEPGVMDEFDIQLTKGGLIYTTNPFFAGTPHKLNDGAGGGGNIQLHKPTTGNFSLDSCPARGGF
jgi:hypothetical protein